MCPKVESFLKTHPTNTKCIRWSVSHIMVKTWPNPIPVPFRTINIFRTFHEIWMNLSRCRLEKCDGEMVNKIWNVSLKISRVVLYVPQATHQACIFNTVFPTGPKINKFFFSKIWPPIPLWWIKTFLYKHGLYEISILIFLWQHNDMTWYQFWLKWYRRNFIC